MILLIWDQFGEEELRFYEFMDGTEEDNLCKICHRHYINSSANDKTMEDNLDKLHTVLPPTAISIGEGNFGPYSAIYVSGFIC